MTVKDDTHLNDPTENTYQEISRFLAEAGVTNSLIVRRDVLLGLEQLRNPIDSILQNPELLKEDGAMESVLVLLSTIKILHDNIDRVASANVINNQQNLAYVELKEGAICH